MKHFIAAYHTDAGIRKGINQDSLLLKLLTKESGEILLAVLCDGMGGMEKGELASATVIRAFSAWFDENYIKGKGAWKMEEVQKQWQALLEQENKALLDYGKKSGIELGTTVTVLLLFSSGAYLLGHVGDTRAYRMNGKITQLTEDHTFVAREIKRGAMTAEQAATDTRRNVLLQCVGVNEYLKPQYLRGFFHKGESVLLCTDGFRHVVTETELYENLYAAENCTAEDLKWKLVKMVELNKKRQEMDNISAIQINIL